MRPKEILQKWVDCFNRYDYEGLAELYEENCINHQTPNGIIKGKDPKGLRGCGFFWIENDKIVYQRGYWDKLSFMEQQAK
ncbi:MAG: hypothetical protein ACOVON_04410 [Sediminibacterium sp.]